jgi:hypothetical protein
MDKITLVSNDDKQFTVNAKIFHASMIQDMPDTLRQMPIPLNFNAIALQKVIEWCEYHFENHRRNHEALKYHQVLVETKKWEKIFFQVDIELLLSLIQAASWLDIDGLFNVGCRKAAQLLHEGSLHSVSDLNANIQGQIAQNVPPNSLKKAAEDRRILLTPEQQLHNQIWTGFFGSDEWFEAVLAQETDINPVLIGKSLGHGEGYAVLSSMDFTGDIWYDKRKLRASLKAHRFDEKTNECTLEESLKILNIHESRCSDVSVVSNVEERLVHCDPDGTRWTTVSYLMSPKLDRHMTKSKPDGRVMVLCKKCLGPYDGQPLRWLCVDITQAGYQSTTAFKSGLKSN